jgi:hypothetical protein
MGSAMQRIVIRYFPLPAIDYAMKLIRYVSGDNEVSVHGTCKYMLRIYLIFAR